MSASGLSRPSSTVCIRLVRLIRIDAYIHLVTNSFNTAFLPISSYSAYDNTGGPYTAAAIVTDGIFDVAKYRAYSPVFISATLIVAYCVSFAAFPAVFVHTFREFYALDVPDLVLILLLSSLVQEGHCPSLQKHPTGRTRHSFSIDAGLC